MSVLVACEESQAVTKELRSLGIEAFSCDIQECSGGHPEWHIQEDVVPLLKEPWDMILAFPPCTHLSTAGACWFSQKRKDGRQQEGIDFFMKFTRSPCERVVIENPVGIMSTVWRKPDQIIQPYEYGDSFMKRTCLWLKGVPKLKPTKLVDRGERRQRKNGEWCATWYDNVPKKERSKYRSKTFPGIAKAMAEQWGKLLK